MTEGSQGPRGSGSRKGGGLDTQLIYLGKGLARAELEAAAWETAGRSELARDSGEGMRSLASKSSYSWLGLSHRSPSLSLHVEGSKKAKASPQAGR